MSKRSDCLFITVCSAVLILASALLIFSDHESFSEKENRALASAPTLSVRSFASGELLSRLSDFCADQFPLREYLTDVKAKCEIILGKRENNGVVITNRLLADVCEYDGYCTAEANLAALESYAKIIDTEITLLCAPRSIDVNSSTLGIDNSFSRDKLYSTISSDSLRQIELLPALRAVQERDGKAWYSTDHHWSTHGAYVAYRALMEEWGIEAYGKDFFNIDAVNHGFLGTTYSKSGISEYTPDTVFLYRYEGDGEFLVEYIDENESSLGFYDFDKLRTKDKYSVFLGGNFARLRIRQGESRPRLLLIKDSFANSVIPFLALHFDIDVIDPRYIGEPIENIVDANEYERILVLCGADTLATDARFGKWIKSKTASR